MKGADIYRDILFELKKVDGVKALISVMAVQDASLDPIIAELERTAGKIKRIF